jgi:hypothetical protein
MSESGDGLKRFKLLIEYVYQNFSKTDLRSNFANDTPQTPDVSFHSVDCQGDNAELEDYFKTRVVQENLSSHTVQILYWIGNYSGLFADGLNAIAGVIPADSPSQKWELLNINIGTNPKTRNYRILGAILELFHDQLMSYATEEYKKNLEANNRFAPYLQFLLPFALAVMFGTDDAFDRYFSDELVRGLLDCVAPNPIVAELAKSFGGLAWGQEVQEATH